MPKKKKFLLLLGYLFIIPISFFWCSWVFKEVWGMFIVPLGAPPIHIAQGMGIGFVLTFWHNDWGSDSRNQELSLLTIRALGIYLMSLLLNWYMGAQP